MKHSAIVLCLTLLSAAGMGAEVDFYRHRIEHTGYFPEKKITTPIAVVSKYGLVNVGIHTASKSSPILRDGTIYVGSDQGFLFAIGERDMSVRWKFRVRPTAPCGIHGTPAVDEKRVYVGAYDGWLYALDRISGRLIWQTELGDHIGSSPVIYKGRIYIGVELSAPDGYLSCVDKDTGKIIYESPCFGDHTHATPTIDAQSGTVFIGCNTGAFFALHIEDGTVKWKYMTGGAVKSTAAWFKERVYFTSWDHHLYCLSADDGTLVWKFASQARAMSSPTFDTEDNRIYFGSHDRYLYCVAADSGKKLWEFSTGGQIMSSGTLVTDAGSGKKTFIFGSADHSIYVADAATGRELSRIVTQGRVTSVPTVQNGRVYVSGDDGWLYVLE